MNTADSIAEDVLAFICNRVNVTLGSRAAIRQYITEKVSPLAPRSQSVLSFDVCASNHRGNLESVKAAEQGSARRPGQRQRIFTFLHSRGTEGATCEEIELALDLRHQTCSARISELKAEGIIQDSGRKRQTSTGSEAAVLIVK